ncbi:nucleotidyl transferase AbiEii/AbiGii toxin family protein [Proteus mirabilis]|nr:nucleotidyl transferase AbiEii/AbiGii toxin family protein [Proteus mirabilis]
MNSIYTLRIPLAEEINQILIKIANICSVLELPFFIAGATSREVLLTHVHGRRAGRHTRDIDIAIFLQDWDQFNLLKKELTNQGALEVHNNIHRFIFDGIELDIIPFGDIASENQIAWPPDREIIMSVDGFNEAFHCSTIVQISADVNIRFCSLSGLLLLKLFAWRDRGNGSSRDAIDIYKIVSEYQYIEDSRLYENPKWGDDVDWNTERLGAILAGSDTAAIASPDSLEKLSHLDKELFIDAIVRQLDPSSNQTDLAIQLINDFWSGLLNL